MQKNILVDLNIILDVLLKRDGYKASLSLISLSERQNFKLYISAHMVTTFAYLLCEAKIPKIELNKHIKWLLNTFYVVPVDTIKLESALASKISDYEDAVVEQAAISCNATHIITRNTKDFKSSYVLALKPEEYLSTIKLSKESQF